MTAPTAPLAHGPVPRPVLTWVPSSDPGPIALLIDWADRLGYRGDDGRRGCVWTPGRFEAPAEWRHALCWHQLELPALIDRHEPVAAPRLPWSPWGTKSGPNFQFFRLLDWFVRSHDDPWILALEPDTVPLGGGVRDSVLRLVQQHPGAWMIGGEPHPATRPFLDRSLWHHLNGAALYRVASASFAEFRSQVWVPSLLATLKDAPTMAFDCLTDEAARMHLTPPLRAAWASVQGRFASTAGILNASTLTIDSERIPSLVEDPEVAAALEEEETRPWLIHVKGLPTDLTPLDHLVHPDGLTRPRPLARQYKAAWGPMVAPLARASISAPRTVAFLHLPKTGGSSLAKTMEDSSDWLFVRFPLSTVAPTACSCGSSQCLVHHQRERVRQLTQASPEGRGMFVKFAHEAYEAVEWVRDRMEDTGGRLDHTLMAVRPARTRMVSMFTDYWTQVTMADECDAGIRTVTSHKEAVLRRYQADARHYRSDDGTIDGRAWFEAFAIHGGGVPFFLSDVFRDPDHLAKEIASGRLVPVPTNELDATLTELARVPTVNRHRVSRPGSPAAVAAAIDESADLIDELAARDTSFDAVLGEVLGAERFTSGVR